MEASVTSFVLSSPLTPESRWGRKRGEEGGEVEEREEGEGLGECVCV